MGNTIYNKIMNNLTRTCPNDEGSLQKSIMFLSLDLSLSEDNKNIPSKYSATLDAESQGLPDPTLADPTRSSTKADPRFLFGLGFWGFDTEWWVILLRVVGGIMMCLGCCFYFRCRLAEVMLNSVNYTGLPAEDDATDPDARKDYKENLYQGCSWCGAPWNLPEFCNYVLKIPTICQNRGIALGLFLAGAFTAAGVPYFYDFVYETEYHNFVDVFKDNEQLVDFPPE